MEAITVYPKDLEEVNLLKSMLEKMKISFSKNFEKEDDDFQLTDEMKRVIDERLKIDRSNYIDSEVVMAELDAKYGL